MTSKLSLFVPLLVLAIPYTMAVPMPGGLFPQDPSNPAFMNMAWEAAKYVNEDSSSPYIMVPMKVIEAYTQVVKGINYYLVVLYGESTCKKDEIAASEVSPADCQYRADGARALYSVKLHNRPWQRYEHFAVKKIRDVGAEEELR